MPEVITDSKLIQLAATYREMKEQQAALEKEAGELKTAAAEVNKRLVELMDSLGMQNFDVDGKKFYIKTVSSAKVADGMKEAVVEWLKADPEGKALVKEDVHSSTLSAFLMERFANGGPLPPKELILDPVKWSQRIVTMAGGSKKDA